MDPISDKDIIRRTNCILMSLMIIDAKTLNKILAYQIQ